MSKHHLSLPTAIIINMNIMLGAGLFVNTVTLGKLAGILSPFLYIIVGLMMLPLVLSMAKLLKIHPSGSFYTFGMKEINPLAGFLGSWSYFVGKLASATLMIHFAGLIIQSTIIPLQSINIMLIDIAAVALFTTLNLLNMRTGSKIQFTFMTLKIIPILFVILSGFVFFSPQNICTIVDWSSLPLSLPFVIFAFAGFEASCSLSAHIQNPERNAPLAMLISYGAVITLSFLYQLMFYGVMGTTIGSIGHYFEIFPAFLNHILPAGLETIKLPVQAAMQLAIGLSSLGGAYGILYSNGWNLQVLAKHNHLPGSQFIAKLNKHNIPAICIIAESFLCLTYIIVTQGNNVPLQQIGAFGCTLAYTFCTVALLAHSIKNNYKGFALPALGTASCVLLLSSCINGFIKSASHGPLAFLIFLAIGTGMFYTQKNSQAA